MKTKLGIAMDALRKIRKKIGDENFREESSGSLKCRLSSYIPDHMDTGDFSEATVNEARRRLLREAVP